MTSNARVALVRGIEGLRAASLEPSVRAAGPAGEILRRGIAVSAYNLLETFIEGRIGEIAGYVNQGHIHFADLPDRLQKNATRGVLEVASSRIRRIPSADVRGFVEKLGNSLAAVNGPINLSALTWLWSGSNMRDSDYASILRTFHVEKPWDAVGALAVRLGFLPGDPSSELAEFAQERHRSAHDSGHQVSNIWIPLAIDNVVKFSVTFDAFASVAATALRRGDTAFLADSNWTSGVVGIRRVVERQRDWAEFTETGTIARKIGPDRHTVQLGAATRCSDRDLLVTADSGGQITDWSIPSVG